MPGWVLIGIGVVLVAAAAVLPALRLRSRKRVVEGAEARARAINERLGYCVETLFDGNDPVTERLLADATERWNTAGGLLSRARGPGELAVVESVAREGLEYVAQACRRLRVPLPELRPRP